MLFQNMIQIEFKGKSFNIISKNDLIQCKKAAGRAKDLADVEELEKIEKYKTTSQHWSFTNQYILILWWVKLKTEKDECQIRGY